MDCWWEKLKPIHEDSNGQESIMTYARKEKGNWQYALVHISDDGEVYYTEVLIDGKRKVIK